MISRGIIVGKIIDDLSMLEQQISIRNKLGQFDLTKICEDFFREILNIIYHKNLKNLNSERSNSPGLDLGDETAKIAFQITSQKGSSKVNETLNLINEDHLKQYSSIKILLIGKKQTTYKLNEKRCAEIKFTSEKNIIDITGLLKEIVVLNIDKLTTLFNIFKTEFRTVKIELEPVDDEGNFESSMHNLSEKKPNSPPVNAAKYLDKTDSNYTKEFKALIKLYNRLANIPKSTREIIFFIVDRGKYKDVFKNSGFRINPKILEKVFNFSENDLINELNILEEEGLVTIDEDFVDERRVYYFKIHNDQLNELLLWLKEKNLSIRTFLNTMNFTILDK